METTRVIKARLGMAEVHVTLTLSDISRLKVLLMSVTDMAQSSDADAVRMCRAFGLYADSVGELAQLFDGIDQGAREAILFEAGQVMNRY